MFFSLNFRWTRAAQEAQFSGKNSINVFTNSVSTVGQIQQKYYYHRECQEFPEPFYFPAVPGEGTHQIPSLFWVSKLFSFIQTPQVLVWALSVSLLGKRVTCYSSQLICIEIQFLVYLISHLYKSFFSSHRSVRRQDKQRIGGWESRRWTKCQY